MLLLRRRPALAAAALAFALVGCSSDTNDDASGADTSSGEDAATDAAETDAAGEDTGSDSGSESDGGETGDTSDSGAIDPSEWPSDPFPSGEIGGDRPARVVLLSDYAPDRAWPVVTLLHGFTASALVQDVYFGVSPLADELGVIVVLPDGTENSQGAQFWNATEWCCDFERTGVDDAGYLMGLLDEVEAAVPVDTSRVVFIGHSNGGFMSYRLACDHADRVTGIVSLAGLEFLDAARCDPSDPVSVLQIHGTNDETVAFDDDPLLPSAPDTAARWVERNGCEGEPDTGEIDFQNDLPGAETTTETWSNCDGGTGVGLWVIENGSHIPGVSDGAIRTALEFALSRPRAAAE